MKTQQPLQKISVKAAMNLENLMRFVSYDGNYASAGGPALGVLDAATNAGEYAPIIIYGIVLVEAGAAITVGAGVQSDSQGRAVPQTSGVLLGYSLDAASAAGEKIRVKLI
ncbi:DUF2190 family protein [Bacteroidetes/Chlorobi group bacterium Naka2016]|jgi:hypothetical protein|nr:MAG: DUF2190 family protein [Bacteroidetes/Chlorobi group bacterium Naka2016]